MNRTYLVTLDQEESTPEYNDFAAQTIKEILEDKGLPVVEVKPWQTHEQNPTLAQIAGVLPQHIQEQQ